MIYREIKGNLFELDGTHVLVHCIAYDHRMGAGIALEFCKRYPWLRSDVKNKLLYQRYSNISVYSSRNNVTVCNLVTKRYSYGKPTLDSLRDSLKDLARQCVEFNLKKLAMPLIGCGLDRLNWNDVKSIIHDVFKDIDVEIEVRYL